MKIFYDKKAEKMFSLIWISLLIIVAGSISLALGFIYSAEVDIRAYESEFLYNQIYNCIIENGRISNEFLYDNFDIFSECSLNKDAFSEKFAFKVEFLDKRGDLIRDEINAGFSDISQKCVGVGDANKNPNCYLKESSEFYFQNNKLKKGYLKILTASSNFG